MLVKGEWVACADGVTRPVVRLWVRGADGMLHQDTFLVDTGADRTVISTAYFHRLQLPAHLPPTGLALTGISGTGTFLVAHATLEFSSDDGNPIRFHGDFAVFTDPQASETSILGRDVLDHLDLIVSRRRNEVLLLAPNHQYSVTRI